MVLNLNRTRDKSKCIDRQSKLSSDVCNWILMYNIDGYCFVSLPVLSLSLCLILYEQKCFFFSEWDFHPLYLLTFNVDNIDANCTAFYWSRVPCGNLYRWIHTAINLSLVINVSNWCMHSFFFAFSIGYADAYCSWVIQHRKVICGIVGNSSQGNDIFFLLNSCTLFHYKQPQSTE